jgi:hypothetical protein
VRLSDAGDVDDGISGKEGAGRVVADLVGSNGAVRTNQQCVRSERKVRHPRHVQLETSTAGRLGGGGLQQGPVRRVNRYPTRIVCDRRTGRPVNG